jgi:hypothetical protein
MKVPEGPPDSRFVYLSDVLPTGWQAVIYTESAHGGQHLAAAARGTRYVGALVRYGVSVWTVWCERGSADACATTSIADLAGATPIPVICTQNDAVVWPTYDRARRRSSSR